MLQRENRDMEGIDMEGIEEYKKEAKECEDEVKKNEKHLKKLESEKKRDPHEGELGVVLWGCVNINTYSCLTLTRIVFFSP